MKIIAHRGASAEAPENTLAAVRLAVAQGVDGVEIDVHLTRDGVPVVLHDASLSRTAGLDRMCRDLTLAQLRTLDVGSWKGPQFHGEPVPTLCEVLDAVPPALSLLVELKEGGAALAARVVEALDASPRAQTHTILMSFDPALCTAARAAAPARPVLGLVPAPAEAPQPLARLTDYAHSVGLAGLGISDAWLEPLEADPALTTALCALGTLSVWTVGNPARARRWQALGADLLTSNGPFPLLSGNSA